MPYGSDIVERLPYTLSNPRSESFSNSGELYDIALDGQPFFLAINDQNPYRRVTAKYRKDQFDTTREPGEQTLTGWWLRSQSSFHLGAGIKYFEPLQEDTLRFRFNDSRGIDVWTQGQVKLLKGTNLYNSELSPTCFINVGSHLLMGADTETGPGLFYNDIDITAVDGEQIPSGLWGEYTIPTSEFISSITSDGTNYYYAAESIIKGDVADTSASGLVLYEDVPSSGRLIRFVKQRLILAAGSSIYELDPSGDPGYVLPEPLYTRLGGTWQWTVVAEGPQAIYVAGYAENFSSIYKITLNTGTVNSLGFPELNAPTVVIDMPEGEIVKDFDVYLGTYAVIVTNKGVRVGIVDTNGDISYGPLLFNNTNCTNVAFADRFAYVGTTTADNTAGIIAIDLSAPTSNSTYTFAYANHFEGGESGPASNLTIVDGQPIYVVTNGSVVVPSVSRSVETGYLRTGYIRYNMLDDKIFKYILPRIDTTTGGLNIASIDAANVEYNLVSYAQNSTPSEANVTFPTGPQEYLAFKFTLTSGSNDTSPTFTGYQVKSLPAIPRQRMIQYPVFCYDHESDALNNQIGYEGYAWERLQKLEEIESKGDTIRIQDFRTGESVIGLIEELDFINQTPTDKRFTGFGGLLLVTVRSVS